MCVSHHITWQVVQVIKGALHGVGVHIQNDHILQRSTAYPLQEEMHHQQKETVNIHLTCRMDVEVWTNLEKFLFLQNI